MLELFPDDALVGDDFVVEECLAFTPEKAVYRAREADHGRRSRRCWSCLFQAVPRDGLRCPRCGEAIPDSRFVLAIRPRYGRHADVQAQFATSGFDHPNVIAPRIQLDDDPRGLVTVYPELVGGLRLHEPAPLGPVSATEVQGLTGALAYLRSRGVATRRLGPEHLWWTPDGPRWFELDVGPLRGADPLFARVDEDLARMFGPPMVPSPSAPVFASGWPAAALSHVGHVREHNEDAWAWAILPRGEHVLAVADGMGGHAHGEVASRLALVTAMDFLRERATGPRPVDERLLGDAILAAHAAVFDAGRAQREGMGTTLTLAVVQDGRVVLGHVGDTRAYLFGADGLRPLTTDHTLVGQLVRRGLLTAEEGSNHRLSHILSQALGTAGDAPTPETHSVSLGEGDSLMLCSDGVWGEVEDSRLAHAMDRSDAPPATCASILKHVLKGVARDNATVVVYQRTASE